jgi:hypothetical protein
MYEVVLSRPPVGRWQRWKPGRLVCVLRHHTTKTVGAILDKRNSNDCLCLVEPEKDGCGKAT